MTNLSHFFLTILLKNYGKKTKLVNRKTISQQPSLRGSRSKGEGGGNNWARTKHVGRGRGKRLQPAHCLFGLSRSPANEKSPLVRF